MEDMKHLFCNIVMSIYYTYFKCINILYSSRICDNIMNNIFKFKALLTTVLLLQTPVI